MTQYNELKIAKLRKTKKGSLATNANILEDLALTGHKFPRLILEWRQIAKLKNTYTDALQDHISKETKRVHTSFLLAATNTGRLASSDPNLQNIPIKSEDGKEIRKAFIADKDNILISADYSQIEMRILADIADVKAQYEYDLTNWPAAWGAPYEDVDSSGTYDPLVDIPGYVGADQTMWVVANDVPTKLVGYNSADGTYASTSTLNTAPTLYGSDPIGIEAIANSCPSE